MNRWSKILIEIMDLVALYTLFLTGEVNPKTWAIVGTLYAVRWIALLRMKGIWLLLSFVILMSGTYWLYSVQQLPPVVAVAQSAPILHVLLALLKDPQNSRDWRAGSGLILLILASALSPEFALAISIFFYIVMASVYLSCRFLQVQLTSHGLQDLALPRGFIRKSILQSLLIFLSAALIFPVLPRVSGRGGGGGLGSGSQMGYTEEVNLSTWSKFSTGESSQVALRVYGNEDTELSSLIPFGLLRTRVLSIFDGNSWEPAPRAPSVPQINSPKTNVFPIEKMRIVRETIGSAALPVPYGTKEASVEYQYYSWPAEKTNASELMEYRLRNRRFQYEVSVYLTSLRQAGLPTDPPSALHLQVPDRYKNSKIQTLAQELFRDVKLPKDKSLAIQRYFIQNQFTAYLGEDLTEAEAEIFSEKNSTQSTLEYFLFEKKKGHCELYASSMALLMRMGGVPTRLVSGFRIGRWPPNDVLTVRMSDAHAWIEYYSPGFGWYPIDPTPKQLMDISMSDWFRDHYDWMSGKWYQYVMTFGEDPEFMANRLKDIQSTLRLITQGDYKFNSEEFTDLLLFIIVFTLVAAILSYTALRFFRIKRVTQHQYSHVHSALAKERRDFERVLKKYGVDIRDPRVHLWKVSYEELRFGPFSEPQPGHFEANLKKIGRLREETDRQFYLDRQKQSTTGT